MNKLIGLFLVLSIFFVSCTTLVTIDSNVEGAEVYVDGMPVGPTPVEVELSNVAWEDHKIDLEANGYKPVSRNAEKEPKVAPIIAGILLGYWPLIWSYGPKDYQYIDMRESN